jgi:hypothetical protein
MSGAADWSSTSDGERLWRIHHSRYFVERVACPSPSTGVLSKIDPSDQTQCPETFQRLSRTSPFLHASLGLDLVRIEDLEAMARRAGYSPTVLAEISAAYLKGDRTAEADFRDILDSYSMRRDMRPSFAGFFLDIEGLLSPSNAEWADDLRDALGLYHHNPAPPVVQIEILVFRYPVRSVPHFTADPKARPLTPPTVLDSMPSPAFCPVPAGSLTGHTVHLGQKVPPLMREVLHPPVAYKPAHLFRKGTIRRPVGLATLIDSRRWHLEVVREQSGRADFAVSTDT